MSSFCFYEQSCSNEDSDDMVSSSSYSSPIHGEEQRKLTVMMMMDQQEDGVRVGGTAEFQDGRREKLNGCRGGAKE
ncbi:unnamed protein product [Linum tenue]|uniref:Uncharacterized protein n=1 Tax=Linum tenue TaxID=586396 RepID=A0AAV0QVR2_9ROSI|nr:unnamed protein product [Linum tenue]